VQFPLALKANWKIIPEGHTFAQFQVECIHGKFSGKGIFNWCRTPSIAELDREGWRWVAKFFFTQHSAMPLDEKLPHLSFPVANGRVTIY